MVYFCRDFTITHGKCQPAGRLAHWQRVCRHHVGSWRSLQRTPRHTATFLMAPAARLDDPPAPCSITSQPAPPAVTAKNDVFSPFHSPAEVSRISPATKDVRRARAKHNGLLCATGSGWARKKTLMGGTKLFHSAPVQTPQHTRPRHSTRKKRVEMHAHLRETSSGYEWRVRIAASRGGKR